MRKLQSPQWHSPPGGSGQPGTARPVPTAAPKAAATRMPIPCSGTLRRLPEIEPNNPNRPPRKTLSAAAKENRRTRVSKRAPGQATASGRMPFQANSNPASQSNGGATPSLRTNIRNSPLDTACRVRSNAWRGIAAVFHSFHSPQKVENPRGRKKFGPPQG